MKQEAGARSQEQARNAFINLLTLLLTLSLAPMLLAQSVSVDERGRYVMRLPEGAHTLEITAPGHTTAWRQVIVPAGGAMVPIDVILDPLGPSAVVSDGTSVFLQHGGETPVTLPVAISIPANTFTAGTSVTLTSVGQQSLAGLLPLGWSPLASAEVRIEDPSSASSLATGASLVFVVPDEEILAANQILTAVSYDSDRDEWIVLDAVVAVSEGSLVSIDISNLISFGSAGVQPLISRVCLVYRDSAPGLNAPPVPTSGSPLRGVERPESADDRLRQSAVMMSLDPSSVLPTQRATVTVTVDDSSVTSGVAPLPSGYPVQAWISEELRLADGSTISDPPFKTDLILYRNLDGSALEAKFHLAPSARASEVFLSVGYETIRIEPYPFELPRGTVIGPEGGRVPGDGDIVIEIPAGATIEPLHAETRSLTTDEIDSLGTINGFRVIAGFELELAALAGTRSQEPGAGEEAPAPVELWKPARATFGSGSEPASGNEQIILARVIDDSPFGRIFELASRTSILDPESQAPSPRFSTVAEDPSTGLPLSGIVSEGRYLILVAEEPIAYPWGFVKDIADRPAANVHVLSLISDLGPASPLGVSALTPPSGIFAVPVVAKPAAPFGIRPRSATTGSGEIYVHSVAPEPDEVVPLASITLAPQPPVVTSISPADGATGVSLTTNVRVTFSPGIDVGSVACNGVTPSDDLQAAGCSLAITDSVTGKAVPGTITADPSGISWSSPPAAHRSSLASATRYIVSVSPSVRGANGTPLGVAFTSTFTTVEAVTSDTIDPSKISITTPDALGRSTVSGLPGALPSASSALPIRRGRDFRSAYQSTAAADGSFSLVIGDCVSGSRDGCDSVAVTDSIDLHIINDVGNLIGIVPLAPFVTEDGRGFIASAIIETTFKTVDGITVTVPAGAFDQPTLVTVTPETSAPFADVPSFDEELTFATAVQLDFDCSIATSGTSTSSVTPGSPPLAPACVARERLQISIPAPSGADPNFPWLLGMRGDSMRGPRMMIVDTLRIDADQFTTVLRDASSSIVTSSARATTANSISESRSAGFPPAVLRASSPQSSVSPSVKSLLFGAKQSAIYTAISINEPVAWMATAVLSDNLELHWDHFESLYASKEYLAEKGTVVIPVIPNQPVTVTGVDAATALPSFEKVYDPIAPGDPDVPFVVEPPDVATEGPALVFGAPFEVDLLEIPVAGAIDTGIGSWSLAHVNDIVTAQSKSQVDATAAALVNLTSGHRDANASDGLKVTAKPRDRVVLLRRGSNTATDTSITLVFDRALHLDGSTNPEVVDAWLRQHLALFEIVGENPEDVTARVKFAADSGGRRVRIEPTGRLRSGAEYVLRVSQNLRGVGPSGAGLRIGERIGPNGQPTGGLSSPLELRFRTSNPGGVLGSFDLSSGAIRESLLTGNLLVVSARDAGILAYLTDDPASIDGGTPRARVVINGEAWGLATDGHGRIFGTVLGSTFGSVRSWSVDALMAADGGIIDSHRSSALVSWLPGVDLLGFGSDSIPVAIPRKLFVATQDAPPLLFDVDSLPSGFDAVDAGGGWRVIDGAIAIDEGNPYLVQRITIENVTRGGRWSADATAVQPATFEGIVARPGDTLRLAKNLRAWGVVSLFGYGVGIVDLNAMESNDSDVTPPSGFRRLREIVMTTTAERLTSLQPLAAAGSISDLAFSSDVVALPRGSDVDAFGLQVREGVLDFALPLGGSSTSADPKCELVCLERGRGLLLEDHPRLDALRAEILAITGAPPAIQRLSDADVHRWSIGANENLPMSEAEPGAMVQGQRGSKPYTPGTRDYLLAAAGNLGLLVIETGGTNFASPISMISGLENGDKLADVLWAPAGIFAVRSIAGTDLAVLVDGDGFVMIADLARVDERWGGDGIYVGPDALFPTAQSAIVSSTLDPRIIWRSEQPLASGVLAPVLDPETGILYSSRLEETRTEIVAVSDPSIDVHIDLGDGPGTLSAVLPLGVPLPGAIRKRVQFAIESGSQTASASAFRLSATLPGGIADDATGAFTVAIESERVPGAAVPQTLAPMPRTHLRTSSSTGLPDPRSAPVLLRRDIPAGMDEALRHQRMFNRFASGWIVPIADPRASIDWSWPAESTTAGKESAGCWNCDRPPHLSADSSVAEILTGGSTLLIRPDNAQPSAAAYAYLFDGRLERRLPTTPADVVRPTDVLLPSQNPPVAEGMIQGTVYLHSGELEVGALDLDAGGRNGWNVIADRTYRSRTLGHHALGFGWDSTIFRRLRLLPNNDVEVRDGRGDVWLFRFRPATGSWLSPPGLPIGLARESRGWVLRDQQFRLSIFDDKGRLRSESDEFHDPLEPGSGNTIRYIYGATGQLTSIIDPVGRATSLTYFPHSDPVKEGLLRSITDWRGRRVDYVYDSAARLTNVQLVDVANTSGKRPEVRYDYEFSSNDLETSLVTQDNLLRITEPGQTESRVTWAYVNDRVAAELWPGSVNVTLDYAGTVTVTDALQQVRIHELDPVSFDRFNPGAQLKKVIEKNVELPASFGALPEKLEAVPPVPKSTDRQRIWEYDGRRVTSSQLVGVRKTLHTYVSAPGSLAPILSSSIRTPENEDVEPITTEIDYQDCGGCGAFPQSVAIGSKTIERPVPHRFLNQLSANNDSVTRTVNYDSAGRPRAASSSGGTVVGGSGSTSLTTYYDDSDIHHLRGLVRSVEQGALLTQWAYPDANTIVETNTRGIQTVTKLDDWDRVISVTTSGVPQISEQFDYDASGRLVKKTRKQGLLTVTETWSYDTLGRQVAHSVDRVDVSGSLSELTTSWSYNLPGRTIVTTLPSDAVKTETLDGLGRVLSVSTTSGDEPVVNNYRWDLDDNLAYQSDGTTATATAWDAHGREIRTRNLDGSTTETDWNDLGQAIRNRRFGPDGTLVSDVENEYTDAGRLKRSLDKTDSSGAARVTNLAWDGAGRTSGVDVSGRAVETAFDSSGRVESTSQGEGSAEGGVVEVFTTATVVTHDGPLPTSTHSKERNGAILEGSAEWNALGLPEVERNGNLETRMSWDESGNLVGQALPARPERTFEVDSLGAIRKETLEDGSAIEYEYHETRTVTGYDDQTGERTTTIVDHLGRPKIRSYPDGTKEIFEYTKNLLKSYTDRQNRTRTFIYDEKGRLHQVFAEGEGIVEQFDYRPDGRLGRHATRDAAVVFLDYELDGNPRRTIQERYANGSGTSGELLILDRYEQVHTFNVHGERTSWTMPSWDGFDPSSAWTASVSQTFDAMGNVTSITRTWSDGGAAPLMSSSWRNAGRPESRTVFTSGGAAIQRAYGYDATNGMLDRFEMSVANGTIVAGSAIGHDGLQIADQLLLGISGETRHHVYGYDARSRLQSVLIARDPLAVPMDEELNAADFREALLRPELGQSDPPSIMFTEQSGHKIDSLTKGSETKNFAWNGSERLSDGTFTYEFDHFGHLVEVREIVTPESIRLRRVIYTYGTDRLVGRRAEYAELASAGTEPAEEGWKLEDRADVLESDGLPADVTFVWDPFSDTIAAIFRTGASENPGIDAEDGLVRQMIHGGAGYDDPIEVTIARLGTSPMRLHPVYDEAGGGQLQAVLNDAGHVVSRASSVGAYGEDGFALNGPAVDRVAITAEKTDGVLSSIEITVRLTEAIDPATLAGGARLATVDSVGAVIQTFEGDPELANPWTLRWPMTLEEWSSLTDGSDPSGGSPLSLSVAVTSSLRAEAWGDQPVLDAPSWALDSMNVRSTAEAPIAIHRSLGSITAWLASATSDELTLYQVDGLESLVPSGFPEADPSRLIVSAPFHAHPWQEPLTKLNYLRARWYDPALGVFLSPDPLGYQDSSNLYAFAGGDPVNGRDPTGLAIGVFLDGTGDHELPRSEKLASHVYILSKAYVAGPAIYQRGIGNDVDYARIAGTHAKFTGAHGDKIAEATYQRILGLYHAGERELDIYGYSRGAALVLHLLNLIEDRGEMGGLIIRVVGLFDPVGSFGNPGDASNPGYDLRSSRRGKVRLLATALNETRKSFELLRPVGFRSAGFLGGHSNIGGTYPNRVLGNDALKWMIRESETGVGSDLFEPGVTKALLAIGDDRTRAPDVSEQYRRCRYILFSSPIESGLYLKDVYGCKQSQRRIFHLPRRPDKYSVTGCPQC